VREHMHDQPGPRPARVLRERVHFRLLKPLRAL
jgi:hypothetical protein